MTRPVPAPLPAADLDAFRAALAEMQATVDEHTRQIADLQQWATTSQTLIDRLVSSHRRTREQLAEVKGRTSVVAPPVHVTLTHAGAGPIPIAVQPPVAVPPPARNGRPPNCCGRDIAILLRDGSKFYSEILDAMLALGHGETAVKQHLRQMVQMGFTVRSSATGPYSLPADD